MLGAVGLNLGELLVDGSILTVSTTISDVGIDC